MENKKLISIIIPSFNEGENANAIYKEITEFMNGYNYEIIYINDGSKDDTWEKITQLSKKDRRIFGICFSRNFGHQAAIEAGLKKAKGDAVIMMDGDGQHPPEVIPKLIKKMGRRF